MKFMMTTAAARRLGVSAEWVRALAAQGKLDSISVDGRIPVYPAESVKKLARERAEQGRKVGGV